MSKVLIIGSGAREHIIVETIGKSSSVEKVYWMSKNIFRLSNPKYEFISGIDEDDNGAILSICKLKSIDLVIIGPEQPLVNGLVDYLTDNNINCFGPNKKSARIEGSKIFSKTLMKQLEIPTSDFDVYDTFDGADDFLLHNNVKDYVIKLDGLASGKGVFLPNSHGEALSIIKNIYDTNGKIEIIIEKKLVGVEVSVLGFCNGKDIELMPQSQDYKRIYDNDLGPNTGGMGSICPANILSLDELNELKEDMTKIVRHLNYKGVLYAGVMKLDPSTITQQGEKSYSVLEFNCRFGDPEAQVILNLLNSDLYDICKDCIEGNKLKVDWNSGYVANVVLSHTQYPINKLNKGVPIKNTLCLDNNNINETSESYCKIYWGNNNNEYTTGGRVGSLVSYSNVSIYSALLNVYNSIEKIDYQDKYFRRDIGLKYILNSPFYGSEYIYNDSSSLINFPSKKMKIAILGSTKGTSSQLLIDKIKNKEINASVEVIVSDRKNAYILERAKDNSIPFIYLPKKGKTLSREDYDKKLVGILRTFDVDLVFLVGYMRIVSNVLINEFKNRIFNIHPSLLPKYGGGMDLKVHEKVLKNNEKTSGCTLHLVDEYVDGGLILMQKQTQISYFETPESLKTKIQQLESVCIVEFVQLCCNGQYDLYGSYSKSGVNIDDGNKFVELIKNLSKDSKKDIGGFCSIVPINNLTSIGLATDGVGTKIEIADMYKRYESIGIDLVAMSVNDLIARGVKPLYFLDYLAVDKLNLEINYEILKSIHKGCEIANCKLVGGETAELGSIYRVNGFDLAGFAVGYVNKDYILPKFDKIYHGCKLFGIPSNGLHSNGFSLIRKIIRHMDLTEKPSLLNEILKPTRIYLDVLELIHKFNNFIYGCAHITGGGFKENLERSLPDHLTYKITNKWKLPEIFRWVKQQMNITDKELNRTFNCGIGMVIISDPKLEITEIRKIIPDILELGVIEIDL